MIRVTGDDGFCTKPLLPKHLDALFIVIRTFPLVWTITLNLRKTVIGAKNQTIISLQNIKHLMTKSITSFPVSWYSAFLQSKLIADQSKLETVKMMVARSKINTISLNVNINKRKSVDICVYKLPINVQNFI